MISKIKSITKNEFVRNVAVVASGTAGAQIISVAFAPVITRVYGPEAFGVLGTFVAILGILTPVAALAYPTAIVLPVSDTDAKKIAKLSVVLAFTIAAITFFVLLTVGEWIAEALSLATIGGLLLLIPVAMLFSVFQHILAQWLIRKKQFKITAKVAVIQSLTTNFAKAGVGWFYPLSSVLIAITTFGHLLHAILLGSGIKGETNARAADEKSSSSIRGLARRYSDFPFYQMPQTLLNAASQSIPVIMLAALYGAASAGFYALAKAVLLLPAALISKSVGDVIFPKLAALSNRGENPRPVLIKATGTLAILGIFPLVVLLLSSESLFTIIFGSQWSEAGTYATWLSIWIYFSFINSPSIKAIIVYRKQDIALALNVATVFLRIGAICIGSSYFDSVIWSIALFSLVGVFHNVVFIMIAIFSTHRQAHL